MKKILSFVLFVCCMYGMHAQNISITGNVKSADDQMVLPGVNVIVKNLNTATVTDFDGNFKIDTTIGSVIEFSYLGFKTTIITVVNENPINIQLKIDAESLTEVVVIGYGTQKIKDVTGSVALVSKKTIEKLNPTEVAQALQGSVSGVSINSSSGSPGADIGISIRGVGSNTDNDPLVIIDGYKGSLDSVNPQDVESITILKDAQAAIYGIDGANGVILLTTKRGRKNTKTKFSYNGYAGFQETTRELPLLETVEYATIVNEGHAANGGEIPFNDISILDNNTDWQDLVFDRSFIQNHSFNFSGGGEKASYYVGASRLDQEGIVTKENSNYERNNIKLAVDVDLRDNLKFSSTINYINSSRKTITNSVNTDTGEVEEFGQAGLLFNAINYAPTFAEDEDDTLNFLGSEVFNPISQRDNTFNDLNSNGLEGSFSLKYEPIKGLEFTSRIGFKTFNNKYTRFFPIVDLGNNKVINNINRNSVLEGRNSQNDFTFENFVTYTNTFGEYHNFSATLGMSAQQEVFDQLEGTGFDVPNNDWEFADIDLALGGNEQRNSNSQRSDIRRSSLFARVQYDFDKRYLISGIIRRDVSSAFSPENNVGYFPSITGGWNLSEEAFWNQDGVVSLFKLRASYGELGSEVGNGLFRTSLDGEAVYVLDGALVNGRAAGQVPNADAQWEIAKKLDFGLDVNLFNNKLNIVADYFRDDRENLLIDNFPVSGISGSQAPGSLLPTVNAGTSRNKGIEFLISYNHDFTDDFSMSASYNVTYLKNEVITIDGDVPFVEGGDFGIGQQAPSRMEEGFPIGYFYGLQTDGIFQNQSEIDAHPSQAGLGTDQTSPGDIRFVDVNNDGVVDLDDRTYIGDPIPDFLMGLNLNFTFKQIDFSVFANAQLEKETVRNYERDQPNVNRLDLYLDRWIGEGTSNFVPRVTTAATNNKLFSDFYVEDSSYLRIQNIQLGYSFPDEILEAFQLDKFRIYASINNVYTFTNYLGYDPAATNGTIGAGIDSGFYPVPRQYLLGLNLNF